MKKPDFRISRPGKYEYRLPIESVGDEKELGGIIEARVSGEYEIMVLAEHLVPDTKGRVEVRGVVENGARVKLVGLVRIGEGAVNTDSFLSLKLLMLDDKSFALAEPELEIRNNEVKASHAASVGRIDEEQLYYLCSRGMERKEARRLIIDGFLGNTEN